MKDYYKFLENKKQTRINSGFIVEDNLLNEKLFDFQKYCIKRLWSVESLRYSRIADLARLFQQLEWRIMFLKD